MVLPLRFSRDRSGAAPHESQLAHTVDISPAGARLGGLREPLQPGQTIVLQRQQKRAQFRVIWMKQLASNEVQAGLEALAVDKNFWGVELPPSASDATARQAADPSTKAARTSPAVAAVAPPLSRGKSHRSGRRGHGWIAITGSLFTAATAGLWLVFALNPPPAEFRAAIPVPQAPSELLNRPANVEPAAAPAIRILPASQTSSQQRLQLAEAPRGLPLLPEPPAGGVVGKVNLKAVISKSGRVKAVEVLSGNPLLVRAAVDAMQYWRYDAHQLNGRPVEAETRVVVSFLSDDVVSISYPSTT
jgi:TonB family protein